jgi:hypothetical protein
MGVAGVASADDCGGAGGVLVDSSSRNNASRFASYDDVACVFRESALEHLSSGDHASSDRVSNLGGPNADTHADPIDANSRRDGSAAIADMRSRSQGRNSLYVADVRANAGAAVTNLPDTPASLGLRLDEFKRDRYSGRELLS